MSFKKLEKAYQTTTKKAVLFKKCWSIEFSSMENGTISLKEALEIFWRRDQYGERVHFNISFRTFSRISKTGGTLKTYEGVKYVPAANKDEDFVSTMYNILDPIKIARDPKHFENRTRNIELPNGEIKKLNIDFIISVNGHKVIY